MAVSSFFRNVLSKASKQEPTTPSATNPEQTSSGIEVVESAKLTCAQSEQAFYRFLFTGSHDEAITVPQKLVIDVVRESLSKKEAREGTIPRLPMVIPKLLRSLRDPDSSAKDYVAIVNKDPVMSAAVLRLANSVYFNPIGAYIGDIERAVIKLGIDGLRSVLSAAVMQPIIQRDSPYFTHTGQRLWTHSLNTAVACEIIGHARRQERFKVYLMGLVHDIGKITLFSELCKQYKLNGDELPGKNAFAPPMKKIAGLLSCMIAKDWQLPDEICKALQEQLDITPGKRVSPYGHLLFQANIACEAFAFTPRNKREMLDFLLTDFQLPTNLFLKLDEVSTQI